MAKRAKARGAEEEAATQYLTTKVKLCPQCNVRGEKVLGCDHMTCKNYSCDLLLSILISAIVTRSQMPLRVLLGLPCRLY